MRRRLIYPVAFGLTLVSICTSCQREPAPSPPAAVRVQKLKAETIELVTHFTATVEPKQSAELSFATAGKVTRLMQVQLPDGTWRDVQEGDVVSISAMQPLASLDKTDDQQDFESATLRMAAARRASAISLRNMLGLRPGESLRLPSWNEFDNFTLQQLQLNLDYASADAAARRAKRALDASDLFAPFDQATIIQKLVQAGQQVGASQPAFRVADLSELHVDASLPEQLRSIQVSSDELPGRSFVGRAGTLSNQIIIENPQGLRPGQNVNVSLTRSATAVLADANALRCGGDSPDQFAVFKLVKHYDKTIARWQKIEIDGAYGGNRVRLKIGPNSIQAGDTILVASDELLHDNQSIRTSDDRIEQAPVPARTMTAGLTFGGAAIAVTAIFLLGSWFMTTLSTDRVANWAIRNRWIVAAAFVLALAGGCILLPRVKVSLMPIGSVAPPVQVRLFGPENWPLRQLSQRAASVIDGIPGTTLIKDDWGPDVLVVASTEQPRIAPANVRWRDSERCLTVTCDVLPGLLPSAVTTKLQQALLTSLPAGYRYELGGEYEYRHELLGWLVPKIPAAVLAVYLMLVLACRGNIVRAMICAAVGVFGVAGAVAGLIALDVPLNLPAVIGVIIVAAMILAAAITQISRSNWALVAGLAISIALIVLATQSSPLWQPMFVALLAGVLCTAIANAMVVPALNSLLIRTPVVVELPAPQIALEAPVVIDEADVPTNVVEPNVLPAAPVLHINVKEDDPQVARLMAARRAAG